ncbi:MAG: choice-of-anchor D domain-containing protein [Candidatus Eisenbacteria bacterium]|nr:choice-of-anchor D domain-containing protein [Candidatus Eisenbacteria bacterium]
MRALRILSAVATLLVFGLLTNCSKKSAPTAPPASPTCSISETSLAFGIVPLGSSADRSFTISNTGTGTLDGTAGTTSPGYVVVGGASYSLGAGQVATVTVRFTPTGSGSHPGTIALSGSGCGSVACSATGGPSTCQVAPTTLAFDTVTVGQSATRTFSITNVGTGTLAGTVSVACPDFALVGTGAYSLGPSQAATFTIRFSPTSAGPMSCTVNTGLPTCSSVSCTGSGAAVNPACEVSPNGLLYPSVPIGDRADATFTIRNTGTGTLSGTIDVPGPYFTNPGASSYSIAAGASQTFVVRFTPTHVAPESCDVTTGTGCRPVRCWGSGLIGCTLDPDTLDFGYVHYGERGYRTFTMSNYTNTTLSGNLSTTGWFDVRNSAGGRTYSIPPHGSAWFGVTFDPPSRCDTEVFTGAVLTTSSICNRVGLRAVATYRCDCTVSPTTLDFGNVVIGDATSSLPVQITNSTREGGLTGAVRVVAGDFVASPSYTCPAYPPGNCAVCTATIGVSFRPQRLGPQIGKVVVEKPAGCLGAGAACDTITCTGTGVTAAARR